MTTPRVLVTRRWPLAVEAQLARSYDVRFNEADRALTPREMREAIGQFDAITMPPD